MNAPTSRLDLAIDVGSDPISGSLSVPGGESHRFHGWIELTAAIESVRRERRGGGAPGRGHGPERRASPRGHRGPSDEPLGGYPGPDGLMKSLGYFPGVKPGWL